MIETREFSSQEDLIKHILNVRDTDIEEEKRLCEELLSLSDKRQSIYGLSFAYVYLFDSVLALGVYTDCDYYLSRAVTLCRENKFEHLFMTLCNLAGLYYLKLNDEQTAMYFFLEGLELAKRFEDHLVSSKLYNNIGMTFSGREDWETAKSFFEEAYNSISNLSQEDAGDFAMSYLCNLAESSIHLGEMENAKKILELCSSYKHDKFYYKIRVKSGWSFYYAKINDRDNCLKEASHIYDLHPEEYENKFFVCDMIDGIVSDMMTIKEYQWAEKFLKLFDEILKDAPINVHYRIQCVRIRCMEALNQTEELKQAYRSYYEVAREMTEMDSVMRAQSIVSKIQLDKIFYEREALKVNKEFLETEIKTDKLTGLYNRRYFNKLLSKAILNKDIRTLSIIMLDIDYFKLYNDFYGHFKGDEALQAFSKILNMYSIEGIYACRYGGDEFICLGQNISKKQIEEYINNICKEISACHIEHVKSLCSDVMTLSIGYCHMDRNKNNSFEDILNVVDEALYKAKKLGRNRYCHAD